jgi:hypothetical protein
VYNVLQLYDTVHTSAKPAFDYIRARSRLEYIMHFCDALGRCEEAVVSPANNTWALPQRAYRLLVEFLQCETAFCNRVVPTFHRFSWVSLRAAANGEEPEKSQRTVPGCAGEGRCYNGRRRLGSTEELAVASEQNPKERDARGPGIRSERYARYRKEPGRPSVPHEG